LDLSARLLTGSRLCQQRQLRSDRAIVGAVSNRDSGKKLANGTSLSARERGWGEGKRGVL